MDNIIILMKDTFDIWPRSWDGKRHAVRNCRDEVGDRAPTSSPSEEKETRAESVRLFTQASDGPRYCRLSGPRRPVQPAHRLVAVSINPLDDLPYNLLTSAFQTSGDTSNTVIHGIRNWV